MNENYVTVAQKRIKRTITTGVKEKKIFKSRLF